MVGRKNRLTTDAVREVRFTFSRFLSILVLSALAVAFLAGLRATAPDMEYTADRYYDRTNLMDGYVLSTLGLTEDDLEALADVDGVAEVEGGWSVDAISVDAIVSVRNLPERLNLLEVEEGRLPKAADECVTERLLLIELGLEIGDTLTLTMDPDNEGDLVRTEYTIVGVASSPLFVSTDRGSSSLGSGSVDAFVYVPGENFTYDYYTIAYLTGEGLMELDSYGDEYDERMTALIDQVDALLSEERAQLRYESLIGEAQAELDDARLELEDARTEADQELADAWQELLDARQELDDGWQEYYDGQQELEDSIAKANREIADAQKELADALAELNDAEQELADARQELDDGWTEYYDGLAEYQDGLAEYEDGKRQYEDGLAEYEDGLAQYNDGLAEYRAGVAEVNDGWAEYNSGVARLSAGEAEYEAGLAEYNAGMAAYEAGLAQYEQQSAIVAAMPESDEKTAAEAQLTQTKAQLDGTKIQLDAAKQQLDGAAQELAAGQAQLDSAAAQLNSAERQLRAAKAELDEAKAELDEAKAELDDAKAELDDAWAQLEDARIELADAKAQLEDGEAEYADGQAELADGWQEYNDGLAELADARATLKRETADARQELADALTELEDGEAEYADGLQEYEDGKAEAEEKIADAQVKLDDAQRELDDVENCEWYVLGRDTNVGFVSYSQDAERISNLANIFPVIFFLVAALACLTTMTRMVEDQRTQIGALKAMGFSRLAISKKYLGYAFSASLLGGVIGLALGCTLIPAVIANAFNIMYNIPSLEFKRQLPLYVLSVLAAVACTTGAALWACLSTLIDTPANLMRPKAPKAGRRVFLEYVKPVWNRLTFTWKVTMRNLFRYQRRFWMTVIGIGGCTALIVTGFGLHESIFDILDKQFDEISRYDATVGLDEKITDEELDAISDYLAGNGVVEDYLFSFQDTADASNGGVAYSVTISVVEDQEEFCRFIDLRHRKDDEAVTMPTDGMIITEKLSELLGVEIGDAITLEGDRRVTATVKDIVENYVYHYAYMTEDYYTQLFGEEVQDNMVMVRYQDSAGTAESDEVSSSLMKMDGVTSYSYIATLRDTFTNSMNAINYAVVIIIVAAAALAFVVLYNLTNINITERTRELATLKVLGFYDRETTAYVYRENIFLTAFGIILGLVLGRFLHAWMVVTVEITMVMFGRTAPPYAYVLAAVLTVVFSVVVNIAAHYKLKKVDMVESLKSVE